MEITHENKANQGTGDRLGYGGAAIVETLRSVAHLVWQTAPLSSAHHLLA